MIQESTRVIDHTPQVKEQKLTSVLTVRDIEVITTKRIIEIPELKYVAKEVNYEKPVVTEVPTTKYNLVEKETIRYKEVIKDTIRYIVEEKVIEKPIIKEVEYEKPIYKEKEYEKPVFKEVTIEVIKNLEDITQLRRELTKLTSDIIEAKKNLDSLRSYKLVEEIIRVPKVEYQNVTVERIVWVDVPRERAKES